MTSPRFVSTRVSRFRPEDDEDKPVDTADSNSSTIILIAGFVLALTISTLVLDNPDARLVAAALAALGLATAVLLIAMAKVSRAPKGGRHIASTPAAPSRHRREMTTMTTVTTTVAAPVVDGPTERMRRAPR